MQTATDFTPAALATLLRRIEDEGGGGSEVGEGCSARGDGRQGISMQIIKIDDAEYQCREVRGRDLDLHDRIAIHAADAGWSLAKVVAAGTSGTALVRRLNRKGKWLSRPIAVKGNQAVWMIFIERDTGDTK